MSMRHHKFKLAAMTLATIVGCSKNDTSCVDASYEDYCRRFALRDFDPVGARSITYEATPRRDGYDAWWMLSIAEEDWRQICKQIGLEIFELDDDRSRVAAQDWPDVFGTVPSWWTKGDSFGSEFASFFHQDTPGERATGMFFLFDASSEVAIARKWSRQYWSRPARNLGHGLD